VRSVVEVRDRKEALKWYTEAANQGLFVLSNFPKCWIPGNMFLRCEKASLLLPSCLRKCTNKERYFFSRNAEHYWMSCAD